MKQKMTKEPSPLQRNWKVSYLNFELLENAVAAQIKMSLMLLVSSPSTIKDSFSAVSEMMNESSAIAKETDE